MSHDMFLKRAIQLAHEARAAGNHPFGAVLVIGDQIVIEALNEVVTKNDVTRHAELCLVSDASRTLSKTDLRRSVLYASTEPCAMCSGAIYWAGIRHVVFGCSAARLGEHASGSFVVPSREIFHYGREQVLVEGPLLSQEADQPHRGFWRPSP